MNMNFRRQIYGYLTIKEAMAALNYNSEEKFISDCSKFFIKIDKVDDVQLIADKNLFQLKEALAGRDEDKNAITGKLKKYAAWIILLIGMIFWCYEKVPYHMLAVICLVEFIFLYSSGIVGKDVLKRYGLPQEGWTALPPILSEIVAKTRPVIYGVVIIFSLCIKGGIN